MAENKTVEERVSDLEGRLTFIEGTLRGRFGPEFFGRVVVKGSGEPASRPGLVAGEYIESWLRRAGVKVDEMSTEDIHRYLRKNKGLLNKLIDEMKQNESKFSSNSFAECWNILKELKG